MKALTFQGAKDVRVQNVPDPVLIDDDDIFLKVTPTPICGFVPHIYRGKIPAMKDVYILGHLFMGTASEIGQAATSLKKGDLVVISFVNVCGACFYCNKTLFAACDITNLGRGDILKKKSANAGGDLFGYSRPHVSLRGGQANYVHVPKANGVLLKMSGALTDKRVLLSSDFLPTGYQAAVNAQLGPGSSVAIYGASPVGLAATLYAPFLRAEKTVLHDHNDDHLKFVQDVDDVASLNFAHDDDPADILLKSTDFHAGDDVIDTVGLEANGSAIETVMTTLKLEGSGGPALRQCIEVTGRRDVVSVSGACAGLIHGILFGDAVAKGLIFKMGQTHAQRYMPVLLELLELLEHYWQWKNEARADPPPHEAGRCGAGICCVCGTKRRLVYGYAYPLTRMTGLQTAMNLRPEGNLQRQLRRHNQCRAIFKTLATKCLVSVS